MEQALKSSWNTKFIVTYLKRNYTKKFDYNDITDEDRKRLRFQFEDGSINIKCCCKSEIEQGISSVHRIYNKTKKEKHARDCCKYHRYSNSSKYEPGWHEEEDGHFTIHLQKEGYVAPKPTNNENSSNSLVNTTSTDLNDKEEKTAARPSNAKSKGQVTLLGLAAKLNMMAWERKAEQGKLPDHSFELLHQIYGLIKKVHLRKGDAGLQAAFITNNNPAATSLVNKRGFFFYLLLSRVFQKESQRTNRPVFYVTGEYKLGSKIKSYTFLISSSMYQQAQEWYNSGSHMICGFAQPYNPTKSKSEHNTLFTCKEMVAIHVTQQGLYCESNYEKIAYEYFVSKDRLFFKPYRNMIEYNDRRPDVIFIDREPTILGEIFGINEDNYLLKREEKLAWAQKNSHLYGFWYWDAYQNNRLYIE